MDRPNTHSPASLYAAFPPAAAKQLSDQAEIHHTPQHGSWPNIAELELAVRERQCPRRRFGGRASLDRQVAAWAARRNAATAAVDGCSTIVEARTKLRRLYPAVHG